MSFLDSGGEVWDTEVVEVAPHGLYIRSPAGEIGFVDPVEFDWCPGVRPEFTIGDGQRVVVVKRMRPLGRRGVTFIGSIRRLNPSANPKVLIDEYAVGDQLTATVVAIIEDYGVIFEFDESLQAVSSGGNNHGLRPNDKCRVEITSIRREPTIRIDVDVLTTLKPV